MEGFESKKRYSKISYSKRLKLIQLVEEQGLGVSKAARQIRMKVPTAKVILSNYRKKGHIYVKKSDQSSLPAPASKETPQVKQQEVESQEVEPIAEVPPPRIQMPLYPRLYWTALPIRGGMIIF